MVSQVGTVRGSFESVVCHGDCGKGPNVMGNLIGVPGALIRFAAYRLRRPTKSPKCEFLRHEMVMEHNKAQCQGHKVYSQREN